MNLETVRVAVSVLSLLFIVLMWRLLHQILRQLKRIGGRVEVGLDCLHILAADPDGEEGECGQQLRMLPPSN